ncbi:MAG: YebC/PmpR family DNA-binding transcriptional regulator [Tenericutes bacterium]|jgi:YebC/PmpR family DNA-binding regulatory protein|nr:YebC/PmpR family DNA-binding transcriptional regulator [Mycoplasmatota bacterium]
MGRAHEVRKNAMEKTSKQKSKVYSKFGKEIYMAAKNGGPDLDSNLELKRLVERAKQNQVPAHVIEKNIEKSQNVGGEDYFPVRYEGYGPGGSTIIVEGISDNVNRTVSEVRNCFTKTGGNMGVQGSVTYMYQYVSYIEFSGLTEDESLEALMMAEVDVLDIKSDEDIIIVIGESSALDDMKDAIKEAGTDLEFFRDEVIWLPSNYITLEEEDLNRFKRFLELTEDVEDVQDVYHNVKFEEEEV